MYYIYINKVKEGPYTLEELSTKGIFPDILVWRDGFSGWKPAKELSELSDILSKMPPDPDGISTQPMPKTWLVESLLVTMFCCVPFGVVGIIESNKVEPLYKSGQYEQALHHSKKAKKWIAWGFFTVLAFWILYLLFWVVFVLFTASVASGKL